MTAPTVVCDAFRALEKKLDGLYGKRHDHDFQKELDSLEKAIFSAPVVPAKVAPVVPAKVAPVV